MAAAKSKAKPEHPEEAAEALAGIRHAEGCPEEEARQELTYRRRPRRDPGTREIIGTEPIVLAACLDCGEREVRPLPGE